MMSFKKNFYQVCFVGLFFITGCKRDDPVPPSETVGMRNITFNLSGFESEVTPLAGRYIKNVVGFTDMDMQTLHNLVPGPELQYLYYWSFNGETLEPDVAVDEQRVEIIFEASATEPDYRAGFSDEEDEAGQALSLRGLKSLEVSIPVSGIGSLEKFTFDISSSGTGPKDFLLSYSVDGGANYHVLKE